MYATVAMILLPVLTYFFAYHVVRTDSPHSLDGGGLANVV
jgi:hypothetical protein